MSCYSIGLMFSEYLDLFWLQVSQPFLECIRCALVVHPTCLSPPLAGTADCDWYCVRCREKTSDYQVNRRRFLSEVSARLTLLPLFEHNVASSNFDVYCVICCMNWVEFWPNLIAWDVRHWWRCMKAYFLLYYVVLHRYEAAKLRKNKILDTIRALELPNNPLDDIIDQVMSSFFHWFHQFNQ